MLVPELQELDGMEVKIDDVIYMPSIEAPLDRPHPFVYFISIVNDSAKEVKILGRKWIVRQSSGEIIVVEGDGVVSQEPVIRPGGEFSYNSYHVISCNSVASGCFFGRDEDGESFFVRIPSFELVIPQWA